MRYALERFITDIKDAIAATGKVPVDLIEITTPKPNIPADRTFVAFKAAKALGVDPAKFAAELAAAIAPPPDLADR